MSGLDGVGTPEPAPNHHQRGVLTMAEKKCSKCGVEKPLGAFRKAPHHKDGLTSHCAECINAWIRDWYYRNKAARKLTQASWHKRNREWRNVQALEKYY